MVSITIGLHGELRRRGYVPHAHYAPEIGAGNVDREVMVVVIGEVGSSC